jgi:hypothetical protein
MLEWAEDESFSMGTDATSWMMTATHEVSGLDDGKAYYFRVKARDALGQESGYGAPTVTIMDASPPPMPVMVDVDPFIPGPFVNLEWNPVSDASGQHVEYQVVVYDTDEAGATPIASSMWMDDTVYDFPGLDTDTPLYFRVMARDPLGWTSEASDAVMCTIDAAGPSGAVLEALPAFTRGSAVTATWTAATDDGIGAVMHRLVVYEDADLTIPVHVPEWTLGTEATVRGLAEGVTYWFVVECRDGFDNMGTPSEATSTTMDATAPTITVDAPGFFGGSGGTVTGDVTDGGSGVSTVEYSVDGVDWMMAESADGGWSIDVGDLPVGTRMVLVRATDSVGNVVSTPIEAGVDMAGPTIVLTSPAAGATVSGTVPIVGLIEDDHGFEYIVEVRAEGASTWTTVQPLQSSRGISGTLATWLSAGSSGGDYTLRVIATDVLGQASEETVTVTLKGAHVSIGPGDITFSDSHPLPGDKVTVLVTVRNDGDSPAEGMTVSLYDKGKLVGSQDGVTVPAHGTAVVPVTVKAGQGPPRTSTTPGTCPRASPSSPSRRRRRWRTPAVSWASSP